MNFIKKIFIGEPDQLVHRQFIRFGIGEYDRAYIEIKKNKNLKIKTSFEFSNDLFGLVSENIGEEAEVFGKIIANYDFESELNFLTKFTKRGKLYTGEVKSELKPEELSLIYEKFKSNFLLLNVKSSKFVLKVGKSLPKPGGKVIKENFCSMTLPLNLIDEFAFDFPHDFKVAKIYHKYLINEVVIPEEFKDDPAKARIEGKRKGEIIRYLDIDGKKEVRQVDLLV